MKSKHHSKDDFQVTVYDHCDYCLQLKQGVELHKYRPKTYFEPRFDLEMKSCLECFETELHKQLSDLDNNFEFFNASIAP